MTEHSKWEIVNTSQCTHSENILYVRGYILGIEDALQDLAESEIYRDETFDKYKNGLERALISANKNLNALLLAKK